MIKKIPIEQLKIGMYIHDLNCGWLDHPFALNHFMIGETTTLMRVLETSIAEIYIDTDLGADVATATDVETLETNTMAVDEALDAPIPETSSILPSIIARLSPGEEFERAKVLYSSASKLIEDIMKDVQLGKQISLNRCEPIVGGIVDSISRFPSALLPLAQMKVPDKFTFQHSVSVSALAVIIGQVLELPHDELKDFAMGGLLHDVGKAILPGRILNKPGKLDSDELEVMKKHVMYSAKLLNDVSGVSEVTFNTVAHHHERYDGKGYPKGLKGDEISLHGRMLAIVDVYDSISSIRSYHKAMPQTEALRKLLEWSDTEFDRKLVQAFIKGIGIYPAGSLVRMESEKLGIVREVVPDKLLLPIVQLIYDCKKMIYIPPEMLELAASNDKIKSHEPFDKWGIDQSQWATAHV